jgi:hypothetical protein
VPDRAAGEALLDLALAGPEDTRAHAAWWIRHRDGNAWRAWGLAKQLPGGALDAAELRFALHWISLMNDVFAGQQSIPLGVDMPGGQCPYMACSMPVPSAGVGSTTVADV